MWNALEFITGFGDMIWGDKKQKSAETQTSDAEFYLSETTPKKFAFRPTTLDQYIGQAKSKLLVKLNIKKVQTIKPVHFILSGNAGCGKTTLANIIGYQLGFDISYQIGGTFTLEVLKDFLLKNEDNLKPMILFIDEIHNLEKTVAEFMYPIVEDFLLPGSNAKIRPFIFMGATTEKFTLIKKFKPLVDRCGADIVLQEYIADDMKEILKQYNNQLYKADITEEVYDIIAKNGRYTPRITLALFDDYIVCKDINQVLEAHRIIQDGLTDMDIKILEHLQEIEKPVGEETLAIISGTDKANYKLVIEPYLIVRNYISRTSRGRVITNRGRQLLQELK